VINRPYVLTLMVVVVLAALAPAQTFTTLYSFTGGSDGNGPDAGVIQDPLGNLYGTTYGGGNPTCWEGYGCGVVFKLDTTGIVPVLHSFSGSDGSSPAAPVARDKAGNLYGTTDGGGAFGIGVVFKIDTSGHETVLHSFTGGSDGRCPDQGLVRDKAGNLYGTTSSCYPTQGTIFKINHEGNFTLLHSFTGGSDGAFPAVGHLTMDKFGNLYGVTNNGGSTACFFGCGVLYELSKKGTFTVLYSFGGGTSDGCNPGGTVVQDRFGNFYGTAVGCGSSNHGTIWKVSKKGKETILHNFAGGTSDGCGPSGGVTWDSKGNLYGLTYSCGANGGGALYKLSAKGKLTLLHSFDGSDGYNPVGDALRTAKGTLYGTASQGGTGDCYGAGCGTVWSYVP
jgi:uncharacterized repeat protein (TIGR03803 family)